MYYDHMCFEVVKNLVDLDASAFSLGFHSLEYRSMFYHRTCMCFEVVKNLVDLNVSAFSLSFHSLEYRSVFYDCMRFEVVKNIVDLDALAFSTSTCHHIVQEVTPLN